MRAMVTGGAGFIGSHLVDALLARGDEVHVVDDLSTGSRDNLASAATLHELDIRDEALEQLGDDLRPEVVFRLAAQADVCTSVERPTFAAEVNVVGVVRVLEAARAADARVVFASSGGAIYGECERPAVEDDEPQPLSPYAASKLAGEEYLATWNRLYGSGPVTCRLANVYGPRQLPTLEGGVGRDLPRPDAGRSGHGDLRGRQPDPRLRLRR
jgi:UDP-glucose 4-epimerase